MEKKVEENVDNNSKKISKSNRKNTKYAKIDNQKRKLFIESYFNNNMTIKDVQSFNFYY